MNKKVKIFLPDGLLEAPIMIENQANNRSIVVSATKGDFNNKLIDSKIEVTGLSVKLR